MLKSSDLKNGFLAAYSRTMTNLKKHVTLVFLTAFTLIKVSPVYYRLQLILPSAQSRSAGTARHIHNKPRHDVLIRVYRAIVEKNSIAAVPQINCSGIPFAVFFSGLSLVLLSAYRKFAPSIYQSYNPHIYLVQGVLRL